MPAIADDPVFAIKERVSGEYTALITGDDMVTMLPGSTLTTLRLTVYVVLSNHTEYIVNGRDQQDVLNTNNVSLFEVPQTRVDGTTYNLKWILQPEDTQIIEDHLSYERHYCLWEWTWPALTGTHAGKYQVIFNVRNMRRIS